MFTKLSPPKVDEDPDVRAAQEQLASAVAARDAAERRLAAVQRPRPAGVISGPMSRQETEARWTLEEAERAVSEAARSREAACEKARKPLALAHRASYRVAVDAFCKEIESGGLAERVRDVLRVRDEAESDGVALPFIVPPFLIPEIAGGQEGMESWLRLIRRELGLLP